MIRTCVIDFLQCEKKQYTTLEKVENFIQSFGNVNGLGIISYLMFGIEFCNVSDCTIQILFVLFYNMLF